jgi:hypothetical protein
MGEVAVSDEMTSDRVDVNIVNLETGWKKTIALCKMHLSKIIKTVVVLEKAQVKSTQNQ